MSVYYRKRGRERECVRRERERIVEQRREQQSRGEHATRSRVESSRVEQSSPAAKHSTTAAMAQQKHEHSESR